MMYIFSIWIKMTMEIVALSSADTCYTLFPFNGIIVQHKSVCIVYIDVFMLFHTYLCFNLMTSQYMQQWRGVNIFAREAGMNRELNT